MLNIILNNPDRYPLELVVNFDLEIDWVWSKEVIEFMESRCKEAGIRFVKIKPRKSWNELYEKYDIPTRRARWCNSEYKLDCKKQLNDWIKSQNCRPVAYIGLCADEVRRFKYKIGDWSNQDICYPLAEEGILEEEVLRWAKRTELFHGWYKVFKRQGCMICPNLTRLEMAYLLKYYPKHYEAWIDKIRMYEERFRTILYDAPIDTIDERIKEKWIDALEDAEKYEQLELF